MQKELQINYSPVCHIAIMKGLWGLTEKILSGEKTVESRWHKAKTAPWNRIKLGDIIYFKDAGKPVSVKAKVSKVLQFADITEKQRKAILKKYGLADLGTKEIVPEIENYTKNKKYCILIFLENPQKITLFEINKKGFGNMAAWITISDINKIKKLV